MRILLTGASGNIGTHSLPELIAQGHQVRCLLRKTPRNERRIATFNKPIEIVWGDIRHAETVKIAVEGCEAIIHLAAVIPPQSNEMPELAWEVNVGGTRNILDAALALDPPPRIIYSSTLCVFGRTRHLPPPRRVDDPTYPTDAYTRHKLKCEAMIKDPGLKWLILRLSDVPQIALREAHPIMFEVPLDSRIETIHPRDAGLALANALRCEKAWDQILLIGGGASCQLYYRDYVGRILDAMGIGPLPESAFGHNPFFTDWLDTTESQRLLQYQRHSFDNIVQEIAALLGVRRYLVPLVRPFIRRNLLKLSPYWQA